MPLDLHIGPAPGPPPAPDPGHADAYIKEYYFLQDLLNKQSADCLEIKKWSVSAASAAAVIGGIAGASPRAEAIVIAVAALGFWLTETTTRVSQWSFVRVIRDLEEAHPNGPRVSHRWARYYGGTDADHTRAGTKAVSTPSGERDRFFYHMGRRSTMLPHSVVAAAALLMLGFALGGAFDKPPEKPSKPTQVSGALTVRLDGAAGVALVAPLEPSRGGLNGSPRIPRGDIRTR